MDWFRCKLNVFNGDGVYRRDTAESIFRISSPDSEQLIEKINSRVAEGTPWTDLMVPELWDPAPGLMTGMILSTDGGTVYSTGLGKALIKLER